MSLERTLSIIKPDGVRRNLVGEILSHFEKNGLTILALKKYRLSKQAAQGFYEVHRGRPFFDSLTTYMSSGAIVVSVLEGERAIGKNRELMGATDPAEAAEGTIRKRFGTSIELNTVHGSDAPETAQVEIAFFFEKQELL